MNNSAVGNCVGIVETFYKIFLKYFFIAIEIFIH